MLLRLFIVVTCWERADLLLVIFIVLFVTFPCGILGQVWYLIVLFPDLCRLSYFDFRKVSIFLFQKKMKRTDLLQNYLQYIEYKAE